MTGSIQHKISVEDLVLGPISYFKAGKNKYIFTEFGSLNPRLYKKCQSSPSCSSSVFNPIFGNIHLSYLWTSSNNLKINLIRIKNIPGKFCSAGLFLRWEMSTKTTFPPVTLQASISHLSLPHFPVKHSVWKRQEDVSGGLCISGTFSLHHLIIITFTHSLP